MHVSPNTENMLPGLVCCNRIIMAVNLCFSGVKCKLPDDKPYWWVLNSLWSRCQNFLILCANVKFTTAKTTDSSENQIPAGSTFKIILPAGRSNKRADHWLLSPKPAVSHLLNWRGCCSKWLLIVRGMGIYVVTYYCDQ